MSETKSYRFGKFSIDLRATCLRREGVAVTLRPKSFDVLVYLASHPGRVISKDELIENAWPDVVVTDNSLVQCIKEVRQALGDGQQAIVETVAKRGYLFTPAVIEDNEVSPANGRAPASDRPAVAGRPTWLRFATAGALATILLVAYLGWLVFKPSSANRPDFGVGPGSEAPHRASIAVVPFSTSGKADDNYFSTGISQDLATALGRFPELAVASPKVVSRFSGAGVSAEDIQRQLQIRYLVEGDVRRSPETIRIAVRLTDMPRGLLIWSQTYDEVPRAIFAIQDDIVVRIAGALSVKLSSLERARAAKTPASDAQAYDLVLRGRDLMTRLDRTAYSDARAMFERAIVMEPQMPAAYVGLGRVDLTAVALGWTPNGQVSLDHAVELARKAIALDEFSPAAHVLLGRAYARLSDYDRAVGELNRAVELNRSDPDSYAGLGDALLWTGEIADSIRAMETAVAMDPQFSGEDLFSLGAAYFLAGRSADAIRVLERVINRREGNAFIYAILAASYAERERKADAHEAAAQVRRLNPFFDAARFGSLFRIPAHRDRLAQALTKAGL